MWELHKQRPGSGSSQCASGMVCKGGVMWRAGAHLGWGQAEKLYFTAKAMGSQMDFSAEV